MKIKPITLALALNVVIVPSYANEEGYSLNQVVELAIARDKGVRQLDAQSHSLKENGIASSTLMDPKLKFGVGGLPIDSLEFDEDAMTNISIGLSQQFSRGQTLELSQKRFNQQAEIVDYQAELRKLDIVKGITKHWIELQYLTRANELIVQIRALMQEMTVFIETNYTLGKNDAQELLHAELQVSQLDEQVKNNLQLQQRIRAQLLEWVADEVTEKLDISTSLEKHWEILFRETKDTADSTDFYPLLSEHPNVLAAEKNIKVRQTQADLTEQAYSPQFGVELGYAYRQASGMNGQPASDLISAYLTMDLPLFTDKRQNRNYAAAQYQVGAAKYQKDLLLLQMNAKVKSLLSDKRNLEERIKHYQEVLVKQARERTRATERGYENNTVQFSEVVLATKDELMISIKEARLMADLDNNRNELAYLLSFYEQNQDGSSVERNQKEYK